MLGILDGIIIGNVSFHTDDRFNFSLLTGIIKFIHCVERAMIRNSQCIQSILLSSSNIFRNS